jgi:hypothetical protein
MLTDAWPVGGGSADAVTLPSTHPSAPLEAGQQMVDQRIDHIFFRPGREDQEVLVEGVQLAGEPPDGVYPSDHRAVLADLRWRGSYDWRTDQDPMTIQEVAVSGGVH